MSGVKFILKKIGIDAAIGYTLGFRIIQSFSGIVNLILVANYLTKVEQGYYFTFGSILAIQIFFELGFSNIITQFVAHESVNLDLDVIKLHGSDFHQSRLASLLRLCVKWFASISVILFIILIVIGFIFFNKYNNVSDLVIWKEPWIILCFTTSCYLLLSPILSFLEGMGKVKQIAKVRLIQQTVIFLFSTILFASGFKLFSIPIATLISICCVAFIILKGENWAILKSIWKKIDIWQIDYKKEIFPFQWKIALSWISGYFIFQLFNPVLFATEGPVVAGQMGMTLSILNAILVITLSWISTKVPVFSGLIANKNFFDLNRLFKKTLFQSLFLNIVTLCLFVFCLQIFREYNIVIAGFNFSDRFLPFTPLIFVVITIPLNHLSSAMATYLRCHKKEPLLWQSLIVGILCTFSIYFLEKKFGIIGMTSGYMFIILIGTLWTYLVFLQKRKEWHNE